jgi:hypothetical protein
MYAIVMMELLKLKTGVYTYNANSLEEAWKMIGSIM